jgi:AAA domain, putative AbiEii toxin, Type IV TA system/AAA ATPase domain
MHEFVRVQFTRFKAFKAFTVHLKHFNILVGPNNAGKSTILAAFRILAAAMRRASARKPKLVHGPRGLRLGYDVDLSSISVAEENIFFNYDDSEPAHVVFSLSNQNALTLFFPEQGACVLLPEAQGRPILTPSNFRSHFKCPIGFVPILGPVEHHELLYEREAARLALFNYRAARNFRNIWYHYPEHFDEFRTALLQTWPGMDIEPPEIDISYEKPRLHMYCPEQRIPRELFWAGFGFQVWCQMLTHIIQSKNVSLFLIDEPDIYLHSDLQRQLLGILRNLGPDILLATHSTEIITEAETDDILLVNKNHHTARRIRDPSQLEQVFRILGSNINPILTQLAKTRRALFVEGKDFQILGKFARKLGATGVGNRREFAVVPVEGFNPERIRNLKTGMETTLGTKIVAAAILDRDYRSDDECNAIAEECKTFCNYVAIHKRKEIENFLLVPEAIDRALASKVADQARRSGSAAAYQASAEEALLTFSESRKSYVASRVLDERRRFERVHAPGRHEARVYELALDAFEERWADPVLRLALVSGKDALGWVNRNAQELYSVSVTATAIIDAMRSDEIPAEMRDLVRMLSEFSAHDSRE